MKDGNNNQEFLWQSFDYPTDTLLPGMKLGYNKRTGKNWRLTCWKSDDDPAQGDVIFGWDPQGYPQFFIKNGSIDIYRIGPWNGVGFSGQPELRPGTSSIMTVVIDQEEAYFKKEVPDEPMVIRTLVTRRGNLRSCIWNDQTHDSLLYFSKPGDTCDNYKLCGENSICKLSSYRLCDCLDKFVPKHQSNWDRQNWSDGCVPRVPLNCQHGDGFQKYSGIKLPDTRHSWFNQNTTLDECKTLCSQNCSCTAYANLDIRRGGSGCLLWFDYLIDIRDSLGDDHDVYIRIPSSQPELKTVSQSGSSINKRRIIAISLTIITWVIFFGLIPILYFYKKKFNRRRLERKIQREGSVRNSPHHGNTKENDKKDVQLPMFHFRTIMKATSNFSKANKLGEGGFGSVYKIKFAADF